MRHTREILRHKWIVKLSHRAVRDALGTSHGTITATLQRAKRAGLDWSAVKALSDSELEACLYPPPPSVGTPSPEPDWPRLHLELRKKASPSSCCIKSTWWSIPTACVAPPSARTTAIGSRPGAR